VYGIIGGANRSVLEHLIGAERSQWNGVAPAAVILLRRPGPIDRDHDPGNWLALRHAYDELAARERDRYPVLIVENTRLPSDMQADIVSQLLLLLGGWVTGQG